MDNNDKKPTTIFAFDGEPFQNAINELNTLTEVAPDLVGAWYKRTYHRGVSELSTGVRGTDKVFVLRPAAPLLDFIRVLKSIRAAEQLMELENKVR